MCKERPAETAIDPNDPIPVLPLPPWLEQAIIDAGRLILRTILSHLIGGVLGGKSHIQSADKRDERKDR